MRIAGLPYPSAILLDWDGTIVDSLARIHSVLSGIGEEMDFLGPVTPQQSHEATIYGRRAGKEVFGLEGPASEKFWSLFSERFFVFDGQVALLEGAEEFVLSIPPEIPVGVVSNNRSDLLNAQIRHLGWAERFGVVVAIDEAPKNKPAPEAALFALERLGIEPSKSVWFVGDTRGDIECARAAGLTSIMLARIEPTDCRPHYVFTDCRPLQKHLIL